MEMCFDMVEYVFELGLIVGLVVGFVVVVYWIFGLWDVLCKKVCYKF